MVACESCNKKYSKVTSDEAARIIELRADGLSYPQIRQQLKAEGGVDRDEQTIGRMLDADYASEFAATHFASGPEALENRFKEMGYSPKTAEALVKDGAVLDARFDELMSTKDEVKREHDTTLSAEGIKKSEELKALEAAANMWEAPAVPIDDLPLRDYSNVSRAEHDRIRQLFSEGRSYREIVRVLFTEFNTKRSVQTLKSHIENDYHEPIRNKLYPELTDAEAGRAVELRAQGIGYDKIAFMLKDEFNTEHPSPSIRKELKRRSGDALDFGDAYGYL